jgi:hypothetical protein
LNPKLQRTAATGPVPGLISTSRMAPAACGNHGLVCYTHNKGRLRPDALSTPPAVQALVPIRPPLVRPGDEPCKPQEKP